MKSSQERSLRPNHLVALALAGGSIALAAFAIVKSRGDVPGNEPALPPSPTATGAERKSAVPAKKSAVSPFIAIDQFGYLPDAEKIAVLRNPERGFDAKEKFVPANHYQLVDSESGASVLDLDPVPWSQGALHAQSGDKAHWLDFSSFTKPGSYYLADVERKVRSDDFVIGKDVYRNVLVQAQRTFFYQRSGFTKAEKHAGIGWSDPASHRGPGQDTEARLFDHTQDEKTQRDVSGGWYDAGDLNKYTAWTADYIITLLRAFREAPEAFGDDLNIPESGNQVPDLLDEVRFGFEHLARLQLADGSLLSVVGSAQGSPPSKAEGPTIYGPATTNATIRAAIALASGARTFAKVDPSFAEALKKRALDAAAWAEKNPAVEFANTKKIAAGEQQASKTDVELYRLGLVVELYRLTGEMKYKADFEKNYAKAELELFKSRNSAWQLQFTESYLDYASLPDADPGIKAALYKLFNETMEGPDNFGMLETNPDPYLAHIPTYTWGSNAHKARTGSLFYDVISFATNAQRSADARRAAERYVHYLHGTNPLTLVYLSNMGEHGASNSVTQFYHAWFADKSELWDEVGVSKYGPPPGFLVGGPNPTYDWDASCPLSPGCLEERKSPPYGQPDQKSYAQFNDSWPLNSWSVTENSGGYQAAYLRLLSKFVARK